MPILTPNGKGAPQGWQWAQDAYNKLLSAGERAKEPVYSWELHFPTKLEGWRGVQWRLSYTVRKKPHDVYVGYDAKSAADGIMRLLPEMQALAKQRSNTLITEMAIRDELIAAGKAEHPIYDPYFAAKLRDSWVKGTQNIRSREQFEKWKRDHKRLMDLLKMKAGILDMTMLEYLTKHPDSKWWPSPPATAEEYKKRHERKR